MPEDAPRDRDPSPLPAPGARPLLPLAERRRRVREFWIGVVVIAVTESDAGRDPFRVVHLAFQVPAPPSKSVLPVSAGAAPGLTGIGLAAISNS